MKKQSWMVLSVLVLVSSIGSMQAQARDPGGIETQAERRERERVKPARVLRQVVDEYTSGRIAGLSDGTEITTSEICETAPSLGPTLRSTAVSGIPENAANLNARHYKSGYVRGFEDAREYTAFNARKDADFCKN